MLVKIFGIYDEMKLFFMTILVTKFGQDKSKPFVYYWQSKFYKIDSTQCKMKSKNGVSTSLSLHESTKVIWVSGFT